MESISSDVARDKHGITCEHSRTKNNEELRFRLKKDDGTTYIRTEAIDGGWQHSHWHESMLETYIVQSGWIGYATEGGGGEPELYYYCAGESFTTRPGVIHTVYLPAEAVIHTVKHGQARGADRFEDSRTGAFTARVRHISERELLKHAARAASQATGGRQRGDDYSQAYMHFDTLIWQVPAWATGIFAIVFAGLTQLQTASTLIGVIGVKAEWLLAGTAGMFGLMLAALSYALYRFRWHQAWTKSYTPTRFWLSPQFFLQVIVNVQAAVLFLLSLRGFGVPVIAFASGIAVLVAVFTILEQRGVGVIGVKGREAGGRVKIGS